MGNDNPPVEEPIEPVPASPTPAPQEPVAKQPAAQPGDNYEQRFKGLQTAYNTLKGKYDDLEKNLTTTQAELETIRQAAKGHEDKTAQFQKELEAYKAKETEWTAQIASRDAQVARSKLILGEFPDLSGFEAAGLLPAAPDEETAREVFTKFRDTFSKTVSDAVTQKVSGTGPAPTSSLKSPVMSKEAIYAEATRLAGSKPGTPERVRYEQLMEQWGELMKS